MNIPNSNAPLKLGTRASPLAMAQAHMVRDALLAAHGWAPDAVCLVPIVASGDKVQNRALADVGGKALWTRELDVALRDGQIDAAVHSMKDVETIRPQEFEIVATLPRADVRDALVGVAAVADLPLNARFGTASPRRAAQLLSHRPDVEILLIRGNVQTRLDKVAAGDMDATFLAMAGLSRLGLAHHGAAQSIQDFLPAPAQGIVGIEALRDGPMRAFLQAIDDVPTHFALKMERAFLAALNADCHSCLAAFADQRGGGGWLFEAQLLSSDGTITRKNSIEIVNNDLDTAIIAVEHLAAQMLGDAPPELRAAFG
jgi:hydroxymethylbilane synthase